MHIQLTKEEAEAIISNSLTSKFRLPLLAMITVGEQGQLEIIAVEESEDFEGEK